MFVRAQAVRLGVWCVEPWPGLSSVRILTWRHTGWFQKIEQELC